MPHAHTIGGTRHVFADLRTLLARASPFRSGDALAGLAAATASERVAAQCALADLPLDALLAEPVVPYEADEVTRLILDGHDRRAFAPIASLTVGGLRDWLLSPAADEAALSALRAGLTPEIVAAVSKIMRLQDLVAVAAKCRVVTRFRNTIGLPGRLSVRLQPNHPTDEPKGVAASVLDGLLLGAGDAVIGVNPATDNVPATMALLEMLDAVRERYAIPTQTCVLAHVTTTLRCIERGAPVDLVFQSIGGTEAVNRSFGVSLALLGEAREAALALGRGTLGDNVMYFETGQGSALSADAHHGVDQQTVEARAYAVARAYAPLLVNTVVGFIGPEYLYDGKQITRAGLEDHFCGKLLGLPMGADVCYTNHAEADQDDMDALLTLLGVAGVTYVMGVPGADDVMLSYQSTSFHDSLYLRGVLGLRPAPEFAAWLDRMGIADSLPGRIPKGAVSGADRPRSVTVPAAWRDLRRYTPARVALGRTGDGLPTEAHLAFQAAHAAARDAVHAALDVPALQAGLAAAGLSSRTVRSACPDRQTYLLRPDLGRRLPEAEAARLRTAPAPDLAFAICDGLSATAVQSHAAPLLIELAGALGRDLPIVIAEQGRVALGDAIGEALGAEAIAVLIGERPGLSAPDSLGVYLTWQPRIGRSDAERNCISNIRPAGLPIARAAEKLLWLIAEMRRRRLTGVALKDEQPVPSTLRKDAPCAAPLPPPEPASASSPPRSRS